MGQPTAVIEGGEGGFEADLLGGSVRHCSCLEDEPADEVVGNEVDGQLLVNHGGTATMKVFHSQGSFDVSKVQFSLPAFSEEIGQLASWILLWVTKGGDQVDDACSKPRD